MTFSFGFRANLELPTTTEKPALVAEPRKREPGRAIASGAVASHKTAPPAKPSAALSLI